MLRSELRRSTNVSVGVDDLYSLKQTLTRTQEVLADTYDWPFLRQVSSRITLSAGQRYYDVPSTFNYDRVERVVTFFNGLPQDIERGIQFEDYAFYNSDDGVRSDPVMKWDIRWTGSKEQVEVWPIPSSNLASLQWQSFRKTRSMVADADPCDLDDHLIVLFAAAELGAGSGMKDASAKLEMAKARLATLKANAKATAKPTRIGIGGGRPQDSTGIIVRVR